MLTAADRRFMRTLSELSYSNPFHPQRLELEREALGREFQEEDHVAWSRDFRYEDAERPNVLRLTARAELILERVRDALAAGESADEDVLEWYFDLVTYILYYHHVAKLEVAQLIEVRGTSQRKIAAVWREFANDLASYLAPIDRPLPHGESPAHLFACLYQLRRAFRFIYDDILGDSRPAAELRAMVWQSVFTHDMRRYRRALFNRMRDLTTLVTGPSGTGKELVARAIGRSQYIAFDADEQQFAGDLTGAFLPINLSALSPTLIESELFGHRRGAFTGAVTDRKGWLEACPAHGAVFLDEIGELEPALQVKLLRVVESRCYSRIGETKELHFAGKLLAATNRDLDSEIRNGTFREDLFYRLCSDRIETPSLRAHLDDRPEALQGLIKFIAIRQVGEEADWLTRKVEEWIDTHIGRDYHWPGNIRELEQCVRNVLIRRRYQPRTAERKTVVDQLSRQWLIDAEQGTLTFADLLSRYCTWVYARLGSYQQTAEALGLDRRTVRAKIDGELLKQIAKETLARRP